MYTPDLQPIGGSLAERESDIFRNVIRWGVGLLVGLQPILLPRMVP